MWRIRILLIALLMCTLAAISCKKEEGNMQGNMQGEMPPACSGTPGTIHILEPKVHISEPKDGDSVGYRPYIQGTVANPDAEVWVIVHPINLSAYWVQPTVSVKGDGTWKVKVYMGRAGDIDVGRQFEILAVANPKDMLNEGDILGGWPYSQMNSQVIKVTRR